MVRYNSSSSSSFSANTFSELAPWFDTLPNQDELTHSSELAEGWEGLDIGDDAFAEASDVTEVSDDEGMVGLESRM